MVAVQQYDRAALFPEILERLSRGEPLAKICRDAHMPSRRTIYLWIGEDDAAKGEFDTAREDGYDAIAERTRATARGRGEHDGGDSTGDVQRDKLIIDTDLKLLAKWSKKYGDKVSHELSGRDGGAIETITRVEVVAVEPAKQ